MIVVGLTGGIGCGKTTVTGYLADKGYPIIDADAISKKLTEVGRPLTNTIIALWPAVLATNGGIDRVKLGRLVFADEGARRTLERILHPQIESLVLREISRIASAGAKVAIYDCPLLVEAGHEKLCQLIVLVTAPFAAQVRRTMHRSGLSTEETYQRIAAQMSVEEKQKKLEGRRVVVIDNGGDLIDTFKQIDKVAEEISEMGRLDTLAIKDAAARSQVKK
jgi:dephospho-CoA kinase